MRALTLSLLLASAVFAAPQPVQLNWLGGEAPALASGVSFGVPWPRGAVPKEQAFTLTATGGKALPVQTWPLAYWPDGSVKWTGVATVAGGQERGPFTLGAAASAATGS